jgi:hypothetical protein
MFNTKLKSFSNNDATSSTMLLNITYMNAPKKSKKYTDDLLVLALGMNDV